MANANKSKDTRPFLYQYFSKDKIVESIVVRTFSTLLAEQFYLPKLPSHNGKR